MEPPRLFSRLQPGPGACQGRPAAPGVAEDGPEQVSVQSGDELERDFLGANGLALGVVGAGPKLLASHGRHHVERSLIPLGLSLRKHVQVGHLGRREKHRRRVRACGHTGRTADAGRGVHGRLGGFLGHKNCVGIGSPARVSGNVAARLNNAVERAAIDDQVFDDRERSARHGSRVNESPSWKNRM